MGIRGGMIVVAMIMVMVMKGTTAETFTVGDTFGWKVPATPDFYSSWAAKLTVTVDDILEFNYEAGHTVATVSLKEAYDKCDATLDKNANVASAGPAKVTLTTEGEVYFFCTIGNHCVLGQKFALNVTAPSSSTPEVGTPPSSPTPEVGTPPISPDSPPLPTSPPPKPNKASVPKPMALTWATLSLFLGALLFGYFN